MAEIAESLAELKKEKVKEKEGAKEKATRSGASIEVASGVEGAEKLGAREDGKMGVEMTGLTPNIKSCIIVLGKPNQPGGADSAKWVVAC